MKRTKEFSIPKNGLYYYLTKYFLLFGWILSPAVILIVQKIEIGSIDLYLTFGLLIPLILFIVLCQICFSYIFAHQIILKADRIYSVGPWSIPHIILFHDIRIVEFDEFGGTMLMKHKYGFGRIYIAKTIDGKMKIQKAILDILRNKKDIKIIGAT